MADAAKKWVVQRTYSYLRTENNVTSNTAVIRMANPIIDYIIFCEDLNDFIGLDSGSSKTEQNSFEACLNNLFLVNILPSIGVDNDATKQYILQFLKFKYDIVNLLYAPPYSQSAAPSAHSLINRQLILKDNFDIYENSEILQNIFPVQTTGNIIEFQSPMRWGLSSDLNRLWASDGDANSIKYNRRMVEIGQPYFWYVEEINWSDVSREYSITIPLFFAPISSFRISNNRTPNLKSVHLITLNFKYNPDADPASTKKWSGYAQYQDCELPLESSFDLPTLNTWHNRISDIFITNLDSIPGMEDISVPPIDPGGGEGGGGGGGGGGGEWNPLPTPTIPDLPEIKPDYGSTDPAPTVPDASNPNVNTGVGPYGSGATPDNVTPGQQLPGDAKPTVPLAGQHGGQRLMVESYAMDGTMMQVLRDTLWRRDTLAKLKDIFEAPEDLIVNIHRLPFNCSIYTNPPEKIDLTWILPDSVYNVTGRPINSPLVTWKYGEVKIPRYYNTYLDFSPYSSAKMYIPFVGFVQLDSKEVVGHTVSLGYSCDLISGDGTAILSSDGIGIIGTYATNFAMQIPITSRNFNDVAVGAIEKFASLAMTAVGGSFATGNALPMIPQSTGGMFNMSQPGVNAHQTQTLLANTAPAPALPPAGNLTSNVEQQSMVAMYNMPISDSSPSQAVSGITLPTVHPSQLLASAMQAFRAPEQPANRQSGGLGGNTGWTSPLTPYIYITYNTPNWSTNHTNLFGLSSNIVAAIGTFKGYTEFGSIQLNAGGIMLDEQEELKRLLTGGVVI